MENVVGRFRNTFNLVFLVAVLLAQVIGLAVQVKRPNDAGSTRLIRIWALELVTPATRVVVHTADWLSDTWHNYIWLRSVRKQNEDLKDQIAQMKMQEVRLIEDANQARRLQLLMGFKEQYITKTIPAQVISTTGSEFSRAIYIDKGSNDGLKHDMPVITPTGIVGKVLRTSPTTSLVLMINDPTSGAGVILEKSRLQGILKGTASGATMMYNVMSDEKVEPGERVITSGGDGVFPKGLPVGVVMAVTPGSDLFLNIRVKTAANLNRIEEVLVITQVDERTPTAAPEDNSARAIDILAQRLPTVAPPSAGKEDVPTTAEFLRQQNGTAKQTGEPGSTSTPEIKKAATGSGQPANQVKKPATAAQATTPQKSPKEADKSTATKPAVIKDAPQP